MQSGRHAVLLFLFSFKCFYDDDVFCASRLWTRSPLLLCTWRAYQIFHTHQAIFALKCAFILILESFFVSFCLCRLHMSRAEPDQKDEIRKKVESFVNQLFAFTLILNQQQQQERGTQIDCLNSDNVDASFLPLFKTSFYLI